MAYYQEAYNASLESTGYPFSQQFLRGNECDYEEGFGLNRGLKTASRYLIPVSGQPLNWQTQRQETYSFDANLDYLVGANYGDGLPNQTPAWGYDAGGNRTSSSPSPVLGEGAGGEGSFSHASPSNHPGPATKGRHQPSKTCGCTTWTYDSLNRIVSSPGKTYTHDVLGNRLTRVDGGSPVTGGHNYTWDILNRMTQYAKGTPGSWTQYTYRADGLRVLKSKHVGSGQLEQTHYRYDGQMGTEDLVTSGPAGSQVIESVTRYGLGARGIDVISRTTSSGTTLAYPIYDAHGNNVGLISRNGANYAVSQERSYDAWGAIRSGIKDTTKLTYCANLGHKEDDESGFVYMRARYYEPGTGRFISEDPARDEDNWFIYCGNEPINRADVDGKIWWFWVGMIGGGAIMGMLSYCAYAWASGKAITAQNLAIAAAGGALAGALAALAGAMGIGAVGATAQAAYGGTAICSAAAAGDYLLAQFAIRLAGTGFMIMKGSFDGASNKPSGVGKAVSAIFGGQAIAYLYLLEMDNE